jgi:hypothetical protein
MFNFLNFGNRELRYAVRSSKWASIRKKHLLLFPKCAACGRNTKIEVHHIKPVHAYPELELELDNLISLCDSPCHLLFGHFFDYKSWNINVKKDCEVYYNRLLKRPKK